MDNQLPLSLPNNPQGTFGTVQSNEFAFKGNVYYLTPGTERLPDFSRLKAVGTVYITSLNIGKRPFTAGFPGISRRFEWFGIRYEAYFKVTRPGFYRFRLISDDGSKLWLDKKLLINNDGIHGPRAKSATVELGRGKHLIRVDYFQGPRQWIELRLLVTAPGGMEQPFSPEFLSNRRLGVTQKAASDRGQRLEKVTRSKFADREATARQ